MRLLCQSQFRQLNIKGVKYLYAPACFIGAAFNYNNCPKFFALTRAFRQRYSVAKKRTFLKVILELAGRS